MASKVFTGETASRAATAHWTPAGRTAAAQALRSDSSHGGVEDTLNTDVPVEARRSAALENRIAELEAELPRRQEAGRQAGVVEGTRAAEAAARAQWDHALARMADALAELSEARSRYRRDAEPELVRLAVAVARRILRRELSIDPAALQGILKAALESVNRAEVLAIRVAEADEPHLRQRLAEYALPAGVEMVADRTLQSGEVRVALRRGEVDAGVETQLAEIENGLAERLGPRRPL